MKQKIEQKGALCVNLNTTVFGVTTMGDSLSLLLVFGVVLCSLLCVFAALRNGGEVLQGMLPMLLCQFYLMVTAMLYLTAAADGFLSQVIGFMVFALGAAPSALKKKSFQGARYCIALGATLIACAMLF